MESLKLDFKPVVIYRICMVLGNFLGRSPLSKATQKLYTESLSLNFG